MMCLKGLKKNFRLSKFSDKFARNFSGKNPTKKSRARMQKQNHHHHQGIFQTFKYTWIKHNTRQVQNIFILLIQFIERLYHPPHHRHQHQSCIFRKKIFNNKNQKQCWKFLNVHLKIIRVRKPNPFGKHSYTVVVVCQMFRIFNSSSQFSFQLKKWTNENFHHLISWIFLFFFRLNHQLWWWWWW